MNLFEVLAADSAGKQLQQQTVLKNAAFAEDLSSFDTVVAGADSFVLAAQREGVDVERVT